MATRRPGVGTTISTARAEIAALQEQVARLAAVVQEQQQKAEQQQQMSQVQQAEIAELRAERDAARSQRTAGAAQHEHRIGALGRRTPGTLRGRASSRRALLKWGGAAAAAATVALVASEGQGVHAATDADGDPLLIGTANVGTSQTSLAITGSSSSSSFFQVDASASTNTTAVAIGGISNVSSGTGVQGSSAGSSGFGVQGVSFNGLGPTGTGVLGLSGYATAIPGSFGVHGAAGSGAGVVAETRDSYNGWPALHVQHNGFSTGLGTTRDGAHIFGAEGAYGLFARAGGYSSSGPSNVGVVGYSAAAYGVQAVSVTGVDLLVGGFVKQMG